MFEKNCKKAWNGTISLTSTKVANAIVKNEPIKVTCDELEGISIYTPDELHNPIRKNGPFESKDGGAKYDLCVYKWKGDSNTPDVDYVSNQVRTIIDSLNNILRTIGRDELCCVQEGQQIDLFDR